MNLINVRNIRNITIVIADNLFSNISLTGSLINIEGAIGVRTQQIMLLRNTFNLIHSYAGGANVLMIQRRMGNLSFESNDPMLAYAEYGGNILI